MTGPHSRSDSDRFITQLSFKGFLCYITLASMNVGFSQLYITVTEGPDKNHIEEEKFTLAHDFRSLVHGRLTLLL